MDGHLAHGAVAHVVAAIDVSGAHLRSVLGQLIGNLFAVVLGFGALVALLRRRFVMVLELAGLAIVVASFVYVPELWQNLGRALAGLIQGT